jgi:predicted  nucleic acid-binding Zn-ribbon protein
MLERRNSMSDLSDLVKEELDEFRKLRDELRVQSELGRADLRDRVRELEKRWHKLESRFEGVRKDARGDAEDVREAVRLLARELKEGFDHLRARLS